MSDSTNNPNDDESLPEGVRDITPEEAVSQHEDGAMHCCAPGRWRQIEDRLTPNEFPWLQGHVGRLTLEGMPDYQMTCVDTKGLTKEQQNYVLQVFYGVPDPSNPDGSGEVGVMMMDKDLPITKAMYDAKDRAKRRRR